jgi:bifunctional DNA-binding transcriptional regulator/antitoxin component of YhaV-PrlF toxin-antitoxin module
MRTLSRVDEKGKITFPNNICLEAGLKPGQLVELKIVGASSRKRVLVSPKRQGVDKPFKKLNYVSIFKRR